VGYFYVGEAPAEIETFMRSRSCCGWVWPTDLF